MLGRQAKADQGDVGPFAGGDGPDFRDVDLARDHLVAQIGDDLGQEPQPISPLVRDQHPEVKLFVGLHGQRTKLAVPVVLWRLATLANCAPERADHTNRAAECPP